MTNAKLVSDGGQGHIGSPQRVSVDESRREQMSINPSDATRLQAAHANQHDDVIVSRGRGAVKPSIQIEKPTSASAVAHQKLAVDEIVANNFIAREQMIEVRTKRRDPRQGANPSRGVDENHQALRRVVFRAGGSRRRGTSFASFAFDSVPKNFRACWYAWWRTRASRPRRTVSVSVAAPAAARASLRRASSTWSVFFIQTKLPS